jgi:hypothetical protein
MMLSPYSTNNSWLHFEAGMVSGAEIAENKKVIPVLYGGITKNCVPPTVQHLQYLFLEEQDSFDAFISEHFLNKEKPSSEQNRSSFTKEMSEHVKRIQKHGMFGSWPFKDIIGSSPSNNIVTYPYTISPLTDRRGQDSVTFKRYNDSVTVGQVVAVRISIIPRRRGSMQDWKFGISFCRQEKENDPKRIFQFHAGCHAGLNSWTVYFTPFDDVQVNEPARLETELTCGLQVWLTPDKSSVACVGIDNKNAYEVITNDRGEDLWRLYDNSWTDIIISASANGNPFQIDVVDLEIDTIPYIDPDTLSIIGGKYKKTK